MFLGGVTNKFNWRIEILLENVINMSNWRIRYLLGDAINKLNWGIDKPNWRIGSLLENPSKPINKTLWVLFYIQAKT